jgi:hypothetical protein
MKSISKEDFLQKGRIEKDESNSDYDEYNLKLYHNSFGKEVNFRIQGISNKEEVSKIETALKAINNFLNSDIEITEDVKKEIFKDYRHTVKTFELGIVEYEESIVLLRQMKHILK